MTLPASESPDPTHLLLHLSDTHFTTYNQHLYGQVDTDAQLTTLLDHLTHSGQRPCAIVVTGDLTDTGDHESYRRLRKTLEPTAEALGARIVWVMGNHDNRVVFRAELLDDPYSSLPVDDTITIDGLRIITLDTTVPGHHYGQLTTGQMVWLEHQLKRPAPCGTILAMHHPPIPSPLGLMTLAELRHQQLLADTIRGTDVRAIIAGHLHYSTHSTFAGVPVSVAAATCYTQDLGAVYPGVRAQNGGQSYNLVHVYPDDRTVHSTVPLGSFPTLYEVSNDRLDAFLRLPPPEQLAALQ